MGPASKHESCLREEVSGQCQKRRPEGPTEQGNRSAFGVMAVDKFTTSWSPDLAEYGVKLGRAITNLQLIAPPG